MFDRFGQIITTTEKKSQLLKEWENAYTELANNPKYQAQIELWEMESMPSGDLRYRRGEIWWVNLDLRSSIRCCRAIGGDYFS